MSIQWGEFIPLLVGVRKMMSAFFARLGHLLIELHGTEQGGGGGVASLPRVWCRPCRHASATVRHALSQQLASRRNDYINNAAVFTSFIHLCSQYLLQHRCLELRQQQLGTMAVPGGAWWNSTCPHPINGFTL